MNKSYHNRPAHDTWHNGAAREVDLYARSLRNAARMLIENLPQDDNTRADWNTWPILLLYREAIELRMKLLVGEGSRFLKSETDHITLFQTHSLRWLAQIVCRIVKKVRWQSDFVCAGVTSLTEFSTLIDEVESLNPVVHPGRLFGVRDPFDIAQFAAKLDALLDLLDVTADALAAEWDRKMQIDLMVDVRPTIH